MARKTVGIRTEAEADKILENAGAGELVKPELAGPPAKRTRKRKE